MLVQPYLFFDGRCEEALEFYRGAVGAEILMLMHFKDNPDKNNSEMCGGMEGAPPPDDKVMHASFRIGETTVMASDGFSKGNPVFEGFSLSLSVSTDAEAERLFGALSADGKVEMPLVTTFYATRFGMLVDRFGVSWMIINPIPQ